MLGDRDTDDYAANPRVISTLKELLDSGVSMTASTISKIMRILDVADNGEFL